MKTISIAMATYNGERFIGEQLESFLTQTILPTELVVTDDGSTDATLDIVASFAARAPFPVRIERNAENLGYQTNFMKAARLCSSDIIAFCDQDDIWLPRKIEICLLAFDHPDVLCVYHNATVVSEQLEPLGTLEKDAAPQAVNPTLTIEPWKFGLGFTQLFRRELLVFDHYWTQSADFYHLGKHEAHDQWFFFLSSCLGIIKYIKEPLALYRRHGANTTALADNSGIANKLTNLTSTTLDGISSRAAAAGRRASIMEHIQEQFSDIHYARARTAAVGYRMLERHYRLREHMYLTANLFSRARQFLGMMTIGGYQSRNHWGVGGKAMVRDALYGVLFPPQSS